jgi:hypothetical protein
MRFSILSDADDETGLHEIVYEVNGPIGNFFTNRFYDDSGIEMAIILMGRDPRWDFKQRIRFVKKENCLYMDLMFDWNMVVESDHTARKEIVAEKIVTEVPQIIAKYKFKDFDLPRFTKDLREWFETHGWIDPVFPEFIEY